MRKNHLQKHSVRLVNYICKPIKVHGLNFKIANLFKTNTINDYSKEIYSDGKKYGKLEVSKQSEENTRKSHI